MPAVNPARLQAQIDQLMKSFDAPKAFHQRLRDIFELYANRTLRMGEFPPYPLIPMYHLPDMVTRQVEVELKPNIFENPVTAIAIADELWMDEFYEIRHITSFILGVVEMENPEPIHTRLKNWLTPDLDKTLTSDLLSFGTHSLQTNFPVVWEQFIESFLTEKDPKMIGLGLQGLK